MQYRQMDVRNLLKINRSKTELLILNARNPSPSHFSQSATLLSTPHLPRKEYRPDI